MSGQLVYIPNDERSTNNDKRFIGGYPTPDMRDEMLNAHAEGHKGYFLDYAKVYWKHGRPCPRCGTEIKKIQLGGRGTYFCPNCQVQV